MKILEAIGAIIFLIAGSFKYWEYYKGGDKDNLIIGLLFCMWAYIIGKQND